MSDLCVNAQLSQNQTLDYESDERAQLLTKTTVLDYDRFDGWQFSGDRQRLELIATLALLLAA